MNALNFGRVYSQMAVAKINDQKNGDLDNDEKRCRCTLASLFHVLELYGWNNSMNNYITLKISENQLLINPHGLLPWEITASKLIKADYNGNVLYQGSTKLSLDSRFLAINCTIYKARKDAGCIVYLNMPYILAVTASVKGLLPLSQDAILIGDISYQNFDSNHFGPEEMKSMIDHLGPVKKVIFNRNEGIICIGETIEEAFFLCYHTIRACQTQILCSTFDANAVSLLTASTPTKFGSASVPCLLKTGTDEKKIGAVEYEAHMRYLDKIGHSTGYSYRYDAYPEINDAEAQGVTVVCANPSFKEAGFAQSNAFSETKNSDSGVCVFGSQDDKFLRDEPDTISQYGFCDDQIPSSESSKELMIRRSLMCFDDDDYIHLKEYEIIKNAEPSLGHRRHKCLNNRQSFVKRSKSLTSGVEKAIFRKNSEKYFSERKAS